MTTDDKKAAWKSRLKIGAQLVGVLLVSAFLLMSNQQRSAIAQVLRDPLSVLASRSPGERGTAALRQTKTKRVAMIPAAYEKLLDKNQLASPQAVSPASDDIFPDNGEQPTVAATFAPTTPDDARNGLPGDAPANPGPRGGFFPMIPGGFVPGGGGGGGGGGDNCDSPIACGTPSDDPTPPVVVSIPEPGTWLMIIVGFFALGGLLRSVEISRISALVRPTTGSAVASPHAD